MANKRIIDLVASGGLNLTDLFEIDTGVASLKVTAQQILNLTKGSVIQGMSVGALSPSNSTTYYFGWDTLAVAGIYVNASIPIPKSGTITGAALKARITTAGSGELVAHSVRVNDAADTLIGNAAWNVNEVDVSNFALNVAVNQGDTFVVKVATPAWVSAPLTVRLAFYIYLM